MDLTGQLSNLSSTLEKLFALPAALATRDPARVVAATAAVIEAAAWLGEAENAREAAALLHETALPRVPEAVIARGLQNRLIPAPDAAPIDVEMIRHGAAETFPDPAHAAWFFAAMQRWKHIDRAAALPNDIWRPDLWRRAATLAGRTDLSKKEIPFTDMPPTIRSRLP